MKGLFVYDGPIFKIKENYYGVALNGKMFEKYRDLVQELNIAILVKEEQDVSNRLLPIPFGFIHEMIRLPKRAIWTVRETKEILEKEIKKVDFVIIRLPSFNGNLACKIAKKLGKPYIIESVGCPWDSFWNHSLKGKIVAPYMFLETKRHIKNAENVMYVTQQFLQKRYKNTKNTIGISDVELQEFGSEILENRLKKIREFHKKEKIIIGTLAAIDVKYKGQEYVIRAIQKLKEKGYQIEYQLVGGGTTDYLRGVAKDVGIEENITFLGSVPHDKVFEWLDSIDLYIQPSNQEGLPRSVVEAMSRACPCIGSNAGGTPELIDSDYIFAKKDEKQLAGKIEQILDHMEEQAKNNFETSMKYKKDFLAEKRREYYKNFISQNKELRK